MLRLPALSITALRQKRHVREFLLYGLVGGLGTIVHYSVLTFAVELMAIGPVVATGIGCFAGALMNYALNYRLTFASDACHKVALPKFMAVATVGLLANVWLLYAILSVVAIHYLVAQCIVTVLVMSITYTLNKFWTFSG